MVISRRDHGPHGPPPGDGHRPSRGGNGDGHRDDLLRQIVHELREFREEQSVINESHGSQLRNLMRVTTSMQKYMEGVDGRMGAFEHRMDAFEHRMDAFEHRMDGMERRMEILDRRMTVRDHRQEKINRLMIRELQFLRRSHN